MKLVLLRHGIRGVPVMDLKADLPIIAYDKDLSPLGNKFITKLAKVINDVEIIFTDLQTNRTFETALILGKHLGHQAIYGISWKEPRPQVINKINKKILDLRQQVEDRIPQIQFDPSQTLDQLYRLSELTLFTKLLKIENPLNDIARELSEAYTMVQDLLPLEISPISQIMGLLRIYQSSVIITHEHIINNLINNFGIKYKVKGYATHFIPPCSGLIFTLTDHLQIDYLYLSNKRKFKIVHCLDIPTPMESELPVTTRVTI